MKRYTRYAHQAAAAIALIFAITGCSGEQNIGGYDAPWRHLHAGMIAYIGSDNTDSYERRQTVCPSLDLIIQWWQHSDSKQCFTAKHGTPVRIERIVPAKTGITDSGGPMSWLGPVAKVRALHESWQGYTPTGFLQPNVKAGTVIPMVRDWSDGLTIASHHDSGKIINLPTNVRVKVLIYAPQLRGRTLFVKILEGPYQNYTGWMGIQDAEPPPHLNDGLYGIVDDD